MTGVRYGSRGTTGHFRGADPTEKLRLYRGNMAPWDRAPGVRTTPAPSNVIIKAPGYLLGLGAAVFEPPETTPNDWRALRYQGYNWPFSGGGSYGESALIQGEYGPV